MATSKGTSLFMGLKKKSKRNPRLIPRRALFPSQIQRSYVYELKQIQKAMQEAVNKAVVPYLPEIERQFKLEHGRFDDRVFRHDGWLENLMKVLTNARNLFTEAIPLERLKSIIEKKGLEVNTHTLTQFASQMKQVSGVSMLASGSWTISQIKGFVQQNVTLIKSVEETYFKDIEQAVFNGLEKGQTAKTIGEKFAERGDISQGRAALIARDQISKLNGLMSAKRAEDAGVKSFIWTTSGDNRVRDSHEDLNGKEFTYNEGASVDGEDNVLPGMPINCRCIAVPVFGSIPGLDLKEFDEA